MSNRNADRNRFLVSTAACLAAMLFVSTASADTRFAFPTRDNTLYQDPAGTMSNGAGERFVVGTDAGGEARRGLLEFDLVGKIPAGSTITGVQLTLLPWPGSPTLEPVALHRVLASWGEGASDAPGNELRGAQAMPEDATWMHRFLEDRFWSESGGDFLTRPSAVTMVGTPGVYVWGSTFELIDDVQRWVDSPDDNFGWILIGNENRKNTLKSFSTREEFYCEYRPQLRIDYIPSDGYIATNDVTADECVDVTEGPDGESDDGEDDSETDGESDDNGGGLLFGRSPTRSSDSLGLLELGRSTPVESLRLGPLTPGQTPEHGWNRSRSTRIAPSRGDRPTGRRRR